MSDSIFLPVLHTAQPGRYCESVEITPDLAHQIVALARDDSEEQQSPPEARIAPSKLILNPSGTMHMAQPTHADAGGVDVSAQLAGMISTHPPFSTSHPEYAIPLASFILTAIRAGKVSGVWCDDYNLTLKLSAQELEIAALRARVAELEKEADQRVKGNASARQTLVARINEVEAERDAARAEVAARESQLQDVANARREDQERIVRLVEEVAALKARKVKIGTITNPSYYSDSQAIAFHTGVQACADAIRAEGIEVSCE